MTTLVSVPQDTVGKTVRIVLIFAGLVIHVSPPETALITTGMPMHCVSVDQVLNQVRGSAF